MTVARFERLFERCRAEHRGALVAYLTVGYPDLDTSEACALAAIEAGADALELGVPFSDPTADGPVIARASYAAIQSGGSLRAALELVKSVRKRGFADVPVILFSYYNPILVFGQSALPAALAEADGDGMLVVDLPPEEGAELRAAAESHRLAVVPLLTPTSDRDRERAALAGGSGFIYYVSVTGVTGAAAAPLVDAAKQAASLADRSGKPVAVGFGIDSREKVATVIDGGADAAVVGTAIVRAMEPGGKAAVQAVQALVSDLASGLRSSRQ